MVERKNPLFETTAFTFSTNADAVQMSPITGRPMQRVLCADIPAWLDISSRLVLPVLDNTIS